jgi:hypothetical protein
MQTLEFDKFMPTETSTKKLLFKNSISGSAGFIILPCIALKGQGQKVSAELYVL